MTSCIPKIFAHSVQTHQSRAAVEPLDGGDDCRLDGASCAVDQHRGITDRGRDVDDLRGCCTGDCAVKLDVAGIERIRSVQASGTDGESRIAEAYRQYIVAYAERYLSHGDLPHLTYLVTASPILHTPIRTPSLYLL